MEKQNLIRRMINDFTHHPPQNEQEIRQHELVRETVFTCAEDLFKLCPVSRELSIVLTKLEEAMFWANASLARNKGE